MDSVCSTLRLPVSPRQKLPLSDRHTEKECGSWQLTQWFCDSPLDEKHAIGAFAEALPEVSCLIHFNGRSFDIRT